MLKFVYVIYSSIRLWEPWCKPVGPTLKSSHQVKPETEHWVFRLPRKNFVSNWNYSKVHSDVPASSSAQFSRMQVSLNVVVFGGDSCSEGCGFESQHSILNGHFSHIFVVIFSLNSVLTVHHAVVSHEDWSNVCLPNAWFHKSGNSQLC